MYSKTVFSVSTLIALAAAQNNNNNNNNNANADSTTLSPNAIQTGSFLDGGDGLGAEDGQALSTTSKNNFINFCDGKTLTNGLQITDGSCNGIVMGDIPAKNTMISSILTFPKNGDNIQAEQDFTITVQTQNLAAGAFTNADATYYSAPQSLNGQGQVIGHTHITVQDLGNSLNPTTPPDPTQFAFFKGINDAGNGKGLLSADVAGGLPAGNFRVCTLTSAQNHQPVIMPVAQRGSQDDCSKFTVSANGGNANANGGNANAGNANAGNANAGNANAGNANAGNANAGNANAGNANAGNANAGNANAGNANAGNNANAGQGQAAQGQAAQGQAAQGQANAGQAQAAKGNGQAAQGQAAQGQAAQGQAAQGQAAQGQAQAAKGNGQAAQGQAAQGQAAQGQAAQAKGQANGANANAAQKQQGGKQRLARLATREFIA